MLTSTEILRTVDDLGRIVIPRDVRRKLGLKSGDTVETFIDVKNQMIAFKKYQNTTSFSERCRDIVAQYKDKINCINILNDDIYIYCKNGNQGVAKKNEKDNYDINIGITYALINAGYEEIRQLLQI